MLHKICAIASKGLFLLIVFGVCVCKSVVNLEHLYLVTVHFAFSDSLLLVNYSPVRLGQLVS